jgi:hypothetical protein
VRVRVACRSPSKIPKERLFELDRKLYLIDFTAEGLESAEMSDKDEANDDDDQGDAGDDGKEEEDYDDLDYIMEMEKKSDKSTRGNTPQGGHLTGGGKSGGSDKQVCDQL